MPDKKFKVSSEQMKKEIQKLYDKIFSKVYSAKRLSTPRKLTIHEIEKAISRLKDTQEFKDLTKRFATALARKGLSKQRGLWRKYYEAARKKHIVGIPTPYSEYEKQMFENIVKQNMKMIKTIPNSILAMRKEEWAKKLFQQIVNGELPRGAFQKELEKHGSKNAKTIARTETAKLQTAVLKSRSKSIGSICYRWLSSNDKRTRPSHRAMQNVIVFWRTKTEEKPFLDNMYGDAGEFPNCRCSPNPLFDKNDVRSSQVKVYNYNTKTIQQVNRQTFLLWLDNGKIG